MSCMVCSRFVEWMDGWIKGREGPWSCRPHIFSPCEKRRKWGAPGHQQAYDSAHSAPRETLGPGKTSALHFSVLSSSGKRLFFRAQGFPSCLVSGCPVPPPPTSARMPVAGPGELMLLRSAPCPILASALPFAVFPSFQSRASCLISPQ